MYRMVIRNPSSINYRISIRSIEKKERKEKTKYRRDSNCAHFPSRFQRLKEKEKKKGRRKWANREREIEKIDGTPVPFVTRG